MSPRPLNFDAAHSFLVAGELRELRDPDGVPTGRQWGKLNRLGCLLVVEPGGAHPLTRAQVAGAVDAALAHEAPRWLARDEGAA